MRVGIRPTHIIFINIEMTKQYTPRKLNLEKRSTSLKVRHNAPCVLIIDSFVLYGNVLCLSPPAMPRCGVVRSRCRGSTRGALSNVHLSSDIILFFAGTYGITITATDSPVD
ncbi:MAG: hypothetical protein F9K49_05895 [Caedimonadaceae bacterium]|nr:MAG: hypothetical protein F9K49_05895 [Caedimonadaceae bacterium]